MRTRLFVPSCSKTPKELFNLFGWFGERKAAARTTVASHLRGGEKVGIETSVDPRRHRGGSNFKHLSAHIHPVHEFTT